MATHEIRDSKQQGSSKKRPRENQTPDENASSTKILKKTKSPKEVHDNDSRPYINTSLANLAPQELVNHIAGKTARFSPDLSQIELDEKRLPVATIVDTSSFGLERSTVNVPEFLKTYTQGADPQSELSRSSQKKGAPHTIIIAMSGLRAAELTRAVRIFQTPSATVLKLFAKHIKLKDAIEQLQKTRMGIGVGTHLFMTLSYVRTGCADHLIATRINDLMESGALKTNDLCRVLIDSSYIDAKKRGILDMKDTHQPLLNLLDRAEFKDIPAKSTGAASLLFY